MSTLGQSLLLVEPCNLRLLPLVISDVLSDLTLPLQRLPVAVGTLPQAIGEVLLPLEDRHQPLLTPLPVKKKNSPQIGNTDQVKVVFPTLDTSCHQLWFCEPTSRASEGCSCQLQCSRMSHTWYFSEPLMLQLETNG